MSTKEISHLALTHTDLLNERYGGQAILCNDDFFAEMGNLVKTTEPVFIDDKYTDRGKWMDGWESRRRRSEGYDWCVLRLGISGKIKAVDINTTHFTGNAPKSVEIEACFCLEDPDDTTEWKTLLLKTDVDADSHNFFSIENETVWTHLRLKIFPDGGVARLRAYGEGQLNKDRLLPNELVDLAACVNGGRAIACSDMFYSPMNNLLAPNRAINMGGGWETKRRRGKGHDWVVIKLACPGKIARVVVDTAHFKGNYPDRFTLEAIHSNNDDPSQDKDWKLLISETKLFSSRDHIFQNEIQANKELFTHVRLNIFPDGGVSRLRIWGYPS